MSRAKDDGIADESLFKLLNLVYFVRLEFHAAVMVNYSWEIKCHNMRGENTEGQFYLGAKKCETVKNNGNTKVSKRTKQNKLVILNYSASFVYFFVFKSHWRDTV